MSNNIATREAYGKALAALGKKDERIVVLDADLSKSTKTADFAGQCSERFINCGIAEQNMMGVAAGLATCGKIPFVSTFAIFATGRAYEQVRNSIVYPGLNVKIAATHAGITVGEDGGSHQSIEDISLMRTLPGMTVVVPADAIETEQAVNALAALKGPAYLRLGRLATPQVNDDEYQFHLGKGVLLREGEDIVIFACGMMVAEASKAADLLSKEGVKAAVANIHTIKPLDKDFVIGLLRSCGIAITAEEHSIIGGLGSAICETAAEYAPSYIYRMGVEDRFGQSGSPTALLEEYGLTAQHIYLKAKTVIKMKNKQK